MKLPKYSKGEKLTEEGHCLKLREYMGGSGYQPEIAKIEAYRD